MGCGLWVELLRFVVVVVVVASLVVFGGMVRARREGGATYWKGKEDKGSRSTFMVFRQFFLG